MVNLGIKTKFLFLYSLGESVFARCLSSIKDERVRASQVLKGPAVTKYDGDKKVIIISNLLFHKNYLKLFIYVNRKIYFSFKKVVFQSKPKNDKDFVFLLSWLSNFTMMKRFVVHVYLFV